MENQYKGPLTSQKKPYGVSEFKFLREKISRKIMVSTVHPYKRSSGP